ncbi:hypothetical protein A2U01_0086907, partial [Trifolium medium]|nr:hypothetical protein [Trifolium medium]
LSLQIPGSGDQIRTQVIQFAELTSF